MGRQSRKKKDRRRDRRSPEALLDYLDETLEVLAAEFTQVTFDYRDRVRMQALQEAGFIKHLATKILHPLTEGDRGLAIRIVHTECEQALQKCDDPDLQQIACREGCHWCCYMEVQADIDEVRQIAENLIRTLDSDKLSEVKARAEGWKAEFQSTGRALCPLNESGSCSVYEMRPLTCRGFNSADAGKCERGFDRCFAAGSDVPIHPLPLIISSCGESALGLTREFLGMRGATTKGVLLAPTLASFLA